MASKRAPGPKVTELITAQQIAEEATWQHKLRMAAYNGVSEADVAAIVSGIVARAKEGNKAAIDFVFNNMLGTTRPVHIES